MRIMEPARNTRIRRANNLEQTSGEYPEKAGTKPGQNWDKAGTKPGHSRDTVQASGQASGQAPSQNKTGFAPEKTLGTGSSLVLGSTMEAGGFCTHLHTWRQKCRSKGMFLRWSLNQGAFLRTSHQHFYSTSSYFNKVAGWRGAQPSRDSTHLHTWPKNYERMFPLRTNTGSRPRTNTGSPSQRTQVPVFERAQVPLQSEHKFPCRIDSFGASLKLHLSLVEVDSIQSGG